MNESNLWFGGDEGIEVVFKTSVNLAYTEDSPNVDPRMTEFARGMDQALLKIGERAYLAYGWDTSSTTAWRMAGPGVGSARSFVLETRR